jgi:hypothetical protein
MVKPRDIKAIANDIAGATESDVILINTGMDRGVESKVIGTCCRARTRTNALVIIVTNGGDADVAYRIARCLQDRYDRITGLISGLCKSAGTLIAIGAHELAFSDHGELGPLDVQLRKADDLWANTSGLTVMNAFGALQSKSEEAFADFALSIKQRTGGSVTYKTAADIATKLTTGLFSHIYQQIEVMHVGEAARAMKVAEEYGNRLDLLTDNLEPGALGQLIAGYPSHSFVIDREEARELFRHVRELTKLEQELCDALGNTAKQQLKRPEPIQFLADPPPPTQEAIHDGRQDDKRGGSGQEAGAQGPAEQAAPAAQTPTAEVVKLPTGTG